MNWSKRPLTIERLKQAIAQLQRDREMFDAITIDGQLLSAAAWMVYANN